MTERCGLCTWVLDEDHAFNKGCLAANAQAEQLEAEVADAMQAPWTGALERSFERSREVALGVLAFNRFVRDLGPRP